MLSNKNICKCKIYRLDGDVEFFMSYECKKGFQFEIPWSMTTDTYGDVKLTSFDHQQKAAKTYIFFQVFSVKMNTHNLRNSISFLCHGKFDMIAIRWGFSIFQEPQKGSPQGLMNC